MKVLIARMILGLLLICLIGLLFSCKTTKIPEVTSSKNRDIHDSTTVIIQEKLVPVPGKTIVKHLNVDSLREQYLKGLGPRVITTTDKQGLLELRSQIDLLTGQYMQECQQSDTLLTLVNTLIKQSRKEKTEEKEVIKIPPPEAEKPNWWQRTTKDIKQWVNTLLLLAAIVVVVYFVWKVIKR